MPKGTNLKLKLYYLSQIMSQKTDDEHTYILAVIQKRFLKYDITANCRSLPRVDGKQVGFLNRVFLVDATQLLQFIPQKESPKLINNLLCFSETMKTALINVSPQFSPER